MMDLLRKILLLVIGFYNFVKECREEDPLLAAILAIFWWALCIAIILFVGQIMEGIKQIFVSIFCLIFRKQEAEELEKCRAQLEAQYRSGDVMWRRKLWWYCMNSRTAWRLAWPRGFATREIVRTAKGTIDKMDADIVAKKEEQWLEHLLDGPRTYSAEEQEWRSEIKEIVERYDARLWKVCCIALFEYDRVYIFRILDPKQTFGLPSNAERAALSFCYDEASLVETFVPWLRNLEQSYDDVESMMGQRKWLDVDLGELRKKCEERFFANYYRFGETIPRDVQHGSTVATDPTYRLWLKSGLWTRLKWWFFVRCALRVSSKDDDEIVTRNIAGGFKVFDLSDSNLGE